MTKDFLIERLRLAENQRSSITGDEAHPILSGATPASVLIGIVPRSGEPHVIFTQRTDHLKDHAGQVSFPGGRREDHDRDEIETALREAQEEIGLEPVRVEMIGRLPVYCTVTGFCVTPIVGWIDDPNEYDPDPYEVADVFEVPLRFLVDEANHARGFRERQGQRRSFYVVTYRTRRIWGATAGMLVNFARILNGTPADEA